MSRGVWRGALTCLVKGWKWSLWGSERRTCQRHPCPSIGHAATSYERKKWGGLSRRYRVTYTLRLEPDEFGALLKQSLSAQRSVRE